MTGLSTDHPTGILNEITGTIHKQDDGAQAFHSICGITYHVDHDHLLQTDVERATASLNVKKCGRCFEGSGGY